METTSKQVLRNGDHPASELTKREFMATIIFATNSASRNVRQETILRDVSFLLEALEEEKIAHENKTK